MFADAATKEQSGYDFALTSLRCCALFRHVLKGLQAIKVGYELQSQVVRFTIGL